VRRHKKTLIVAISVVALLAVGMIVVLVHPWRTERSRSAFNTTVGPWMKPGSTQIDWVRINGLSKYDFALNSESGNANKPVKGQLQVHFDTGALDKLPKSLTVYKSLPLVESEKQFKEIAARFGLHGELRRGNVLIENGDTGLYYDPEQDQLSYLDNEASRIPTQVPHVPSLAVCEQIATTYAKRMGLLPPGAHAIAQSEETGTLRKLTGNQDHVFKRTIVFGEDSKVNGYIVRGSGMQLRIAIGDKGAVCSMEDNLRSLETFGTYPLKPIDQALAEAQAGKDTVNLQANVENPTVNAVDIFYYCDTSDRTHGLLMPVYAFMSDNCCIYVPAVNEK
jgi:hypothetical protein